MCLWGLFVPIRAQTVIRAVLVFRCVSGVFAYTCVSTCTRHSEGHAALQGCELFFCGSDDTPTHTHPVQKLKDAVCDSSRVLRQQRSVESKPGPQPHITHLPHTLAHIASPDFHGLRGLPRAHVLPVLLNLLREQSSGESSNTRTVKRR